VVWQAERVSASVPEIVNPLGAEELPGWLATMATTFLEERESESTAKWARNVARGWEPERAWGARDHGAWVATLRTFARTLTVPGHDGATELLTADALSAVTVAATHRRRGLLTRMLGGSLRAARERGDAVSILIAAEWPIYRRFGYAPAAFTACRTLHRERRGSAVVGDLERVRQVERAEFARIAPDVYDRVRRRRAGQVDRDPPWWDRTLGIGDWEATDDLPHNYIVHEGDDGPEGLFAWTTKHEPDGLHPPLATVRAYGPEAATDDATRDLWCYLTGIDLVDRIELSGPVDEPVNWLLADARALRTTEILDHLWLKLLDVPAALAGRRYTVSGELVLEVVDDTEVSVAGRYRLSAEEDHAAAEPTTATPDLTLAQTALASAYLGGVSLRSQRIAGTVTEHTPGALQRADAMFATALAPYNATGF
jgi:predicted acetyltransferase